MRKLFITLLFASTGISLAAQETAAATTSSFRSLTQPDMWEVGVHVGPSLVIGDLDPKIGFGAGLHLRRAFDHIFSVRGVGMYAANSSESGSRSSKLNYYSASAQAVITLNNMRFDKPQRKVLFHIFAGAGLNGFKVSDIQGIENPDIRNGEIKGSTQGQAEGGAGISFRVNRKFNISLEHTAILSFGKGADNLDGFNNLGAQTTTYRDLLQYPHVSLNFNIGGKSKTGAMKSEPLYWVNPMGEVSNAIAALEARPIYDPTDTDGDGIIDAIDDEDNSPAGARVDNRGVTLDSDGDKVPDYKDKEPYSPPGYPVDAMGVAQVPKPNYTTEADVNRIVDAKLANFKLPAQPSVTDWFLPMVNFDFNNYTIKRSEYEKLYQVAQVIKSNPTLRFVVTGNTDRKSSERYNNVLSYNRAKAAIEFLVSQYGIARDRLVLNWAGEGNAIIPTDAKNYTNRRVEFRVAKSETEMGRPEGPDAGRGRFNGNKDAGF